MVGPLRPRNAAQNNKMTVFRFSIPLAFTCLPLVGEAPQPISNFTKTYCFECHDAAKEKGDFRIDNLHWDLTDKDSREQWDLVYEYVELGDMPEEEAKKHPNKETLEAFLAQLEAAMEEADQQAPVGGTPLRRLNRNEYLNTVRDLFGIRMINLPASFPDDSSEAEFDTMPEGVFLSPAVMEAYHEVATLIADRMVPLPSSKRYQSHMTVGEIGGDAGRRWFDPDNEYLMFTGLNYSGWVGALWDPLFIAPESGVYHVHLLANAQAETGADGKPFRLSFHAFDPTEEQLPKRYIRHRATPVGEIEVPAGDPQWITAQIYMEAGETFHVYCDNRLGVDEFTEVAVNRGAVNVDIKAVKARTEPTVELREMKVEGPVDILPRVNDFFGTYPPRLNRRELERLLIPIAKKAYRRPLTTDEKETLITSVIDHGREVGKPEYAWHYGIRRILCSPAFLYREAEPKDQPTPLSQHALASRLSYTFWSTLPDQELIQLANQGRLSQPDILKTQIKRLLSDPKSQQYIKHFTGQWLGNRLVESINVCDNRYTWDDNVRYGFVRSTERFFEEILRKNLPISTFIDSDFTYANNAIQTVWGLEGARALDRIAADQRQSLIWPEPDRIDLTQLPEGTPAHVRIRGGILGLHGPLTVTGDGVESSPILRGVWVLENLFGKRPPPPPKDVPALDIDTSQATNIRETLALHQQLDTCAKCHRDIDPLGLALENYDGIGGWRERYLGEPSPIDAASVTPEGHQLNGPQSIKDYLLQNPDYFTRCLITKFLEYSAGRELSVGDERIVDELVTAEPELGYKFEDLLIAATMSDVFLTK